MVFATRYLDLFTSYVSLYNSVMKVVFLASAAAIVHAMLRDPVVRRSYDRAQDTFRVAFLVFPALLLALLTSARRSDVMETLWTFSIYLESVAILPQLVLMQRTQNLDNLTGHYVFLLGSYRGLYMLNWIYRWLVEPGYRAWRAWIAGTLQTALYGDFFYYYIQCMRNSQKLTLPN